MQHEKYINATSVTFTKTLILSRAFLNPPLAGATTLLVYTENSIFLLPPPLRQKFQLCSIYISLRLLRARCAHTINTRGNFHINHISSAHIRKPGCANTQQKRPSSKSKRHATLRIQPKEVCTQSPSFPSSTSIAFVVCAFIFKPLLKKKLTSPHHFFFV